MVATQILATVEAGRLQGGVEALVSGQYSITLTSQSEQELRAFVANGDGKQYGVVLTAGQSFCSCPDFLYRKTTCKHQVLLALWALRHPAEPKVEQVVSC